MSKLRRTIVALTLGFLLGCPGPEPPVAPPQSTQAPTVVLDSTSSSPSSAPIPSAPAEETNETIEAELTLTVVDNDIDATKDNGPIQLAITLTNRGKGKVSPGSFFGLWVDLEDNLRMRHKQSGAELALHNWTQRGIPAPHALEPIVLAPGESHTESLTVHARYERDYLWVPPGQEVLDVATARPKHGALQRGEYSVWTSCTVSPPRGARKLAVRSNEVTVRLR